MEVLSRSLFFYTLLPLGLFTLAGAQGTRPPVNVEKARGPPQVPNSEYFWRRFGCSVAVLGDRLYIEGGKVFQDPGSNTSEMTYSYPYQLNKTIYISLTDRWSAGDITAKILENHDLEDSDEVTLWPSEKKDDNKLYRWGGTVFNENWNQSKPALAVFSGQGPPPTSSGVDNSGSWSNNTAIPSSVNPDLLRTTGGSWTTCNGRGFLLGGTTPYFMDTASNLAPAVPGLITLDMEKGEMSNVSAAEFGPPGVARGTHRRGSAVCLSTFGTEKKGVVLFLGGEQQTTMSSFEWSPMNLSTVYMYDVATQTFHNQTTTGAIPSPRERPCAVSTHKKDGNSYEIFLWGGKNTTTLFSEVYVLTVPGFTWFKAHDLEAARYQQSCAVVGQGQRQMINVGGLQSVSRRENSYGIDSWKNGLKIFDLTGWYWRDIFEPSSEAYEPHTEIQKWYSSQKNLQSVQWTDEKTKALFPLASQDNTPSNPGTAQPETPQDGAESRPVPVGGIVGGVVGGVVLLAAAILFFILRRRRRLRQEWALEQQNRQQAHDEQGNTDRDASGNQVSPVDSADVYDKQMLDSNQVHEMPPQEKAYEMANDGALSEMPGGSGAYYYQLDDGTIVVEMPHNKDVPVEIAHNQAIRPQELSADSPQRRQADAEGLRDPGGDGGVGNGTRGYT